MSTLKEDLTAIKEIQDGLVGNKVARFSYTQNAYDANTVDGVNEYNVNNEQNIPNGTASIMKVNSTVLDKGYRAQASSITRMLMNHFLGRISYNLNKVNDNMQSLLNTLSTNLDKANGIATLDASGHVATANKVANSLTFGSKTYDGSSNQTITASDLGLLPPNLAKMITFYLKDSSNVVTTYIVPEDGWILNFLTKNLTRTSLIIDGVDGNIDEITPTQFIYSTTATTVSKMTVNCPFPVKKGQVISISSNNTSFGVTSIVFAPCLSD